MPITETTRSTRRRLAGAGGQLAVEEEDVGGAEGADQREHPVQQRHALARRALESRVGQEGQEDREGQVDGARLGVVEDADAQRKGQRRGDPQLEQAPAQRDGQQQPGHHRAGLASARVVVGDQLLDVDRGDVGLLLAEHGYALLRLASRVIKRHRPQNGACAGNLDQGGTDHIQPFSL
jgi:hypothetical protein